jgi:hypothetical protein
MIWLLVVGIEILVVVITAVDAGDNVTRPSKPRGADCGRHVDGARSNGGLLVDADMRRPVVHIMPRAFHRFAHTM